MKTSHVLNVITNKPSFSEAKTNHTNKFKKLLILVLPLALSSFTATAEEVNNMLEQSYTTIDDSTGDNVIGYSNHSMMLLALSPLYYWNNKPTQLSYKIDYTFYPKATDCQNVNGSYTRSFQRNLTNPYPAWNPLPIVYSMPTKFLCQWADEASSVKICSIQKFQQLSLRYRIFDQFSKLQSSTCFSQIDCSSGAECTTNLLQQPMPNF